MQAASIAGCVVALAALGCGAVARAADVSQRDTEKYILDSEAAWAESVARSDPSVVRRILADDVVWVIDGKVLDKSQAIAGAAESNDFAANHLEYAHVRLFGDTALVQGAESWTRKDGTTGRFVWTDTWLRRNGEWQIVMAEDSTQANERPAPCGAGSHLRAAR
jgi:ketosteroid isomerase-like protein